MEFNEINVAEYENKVLKPALDMMIKAKKNLLIGAGLLALFLILAFLLSSKGSLIIVAYIGITIGLIITAYSIKTIFIARRQKITYDEMLNDPDCVVVNEDFTIDLYKKSIQKVHIIEVEKVLWVEGDYSIYVKGKIEQSVTYGNKQECNISAFLKNKNELISCLLLNQKINQMKNYQNKTLKSIFNMEKEQRNKTFVQELSHSGFLIPVRLADDQKYPHFCMSEANINIELLHQKGKICVYTSAAEYMNKHVGFSQFYQIHFSDIIDFIKVQDKKGVMKQSEIALIINPDSDCVILDQEQIEKFRK